MFEDYVLPDFKTYYKATVIQTVRTGINTSSPLVWTNGLDERTQK